jgi:hypothetical protein
MPTITSWTDVLPSRLRYYIGDVASPQTYSDATLQSYLTLGASVVISEVRLIKVNFTIDTLNNTITPDPIISADIDHGIASLFVFKAGAIIAISEMRKDVSKFGIKIKDDVTSYDGTGALKGRMDAHKMYLENYETAKWAWERGNKAVLKAVFGPYESANIGQTSVDFYWPTISRR